MDEAYIYRCIPLAALFATLGVIFPIFFHLVGLGSAFLPMFIPVMMGATLLPPSIAVAVAIITPLVSFVLTGMPPVYPPMLFIIIVELIVVSLICSVFYGKKKLPIGWTLLIALAIDRLLLFGMIQLITKQLGFSEKLFSLGVIFYGIPGMVLILIIIPLSLKFLRSKYPQIVPSTGRQ